MIIPSFVNVDYLFRKVEMKDTQKKKVITYTALRYKKLTFLSLWSGLKAKSPGIIQIVHFSSLLFCMATKLPNVKQMFLSSDAQKVAHKQPYVHMRGV